jgi:uncharacterized protein YkwD
MITATRSMTMVNSFLRLISALILLIMPAMLSCAPSRTPPPDHVRTGKPKPVIGADTLAKRIHSLINRERANQGLSPLSWDNALARIARGHSRDMAVRTYFSHDSPEGRDFSYRYRQEGYSCAVRTGNTIYTGAENIFQNNLYDSVTTVNGRASYDWNSEERIAETTVRGWMLSPGHRKNILIPHWRNEGIGIFIAPDDKVFITQNFC